MKKELYIKTIKKLIETREKEETIKNEFLRGYNQGELYTLKQILEDLENLE